MPSAGGPEAAVAVGRHREDARRDRREATRSQAAITARRAATVSRGHGAPAARATRARAASSRDDAAQVAPQRVEVDLVAQPRAERLERLRRVVAAAVEAAVDDPWMRARRAEQRRHRERRDRDREVELGRRPATEQQHERRGRPPPSVAVSAP